jgi:signal transduction histidine kinase
MRSINRVSLSFFFLCLTTSFWQGIWALLFQTSDQNTAHMLVKLGYMLIIFLPTSFYMFIAEMCNKGSERRFVLLSYGVASVLAVSLLSSDLFVAGEYRYFFGFYPKAGMLHPVHVLQTMIVAFRCYIIIRAKLQQASGREFSRLRLCQISLCIFTFAALDYLCNYGFEFYPPGALFLIVSFACFSYAIARYDMTNPYAFAANVAHELRTPIVAVKMYTELLAKNLPVLCASYEERSADGNMPAPIGTSTLKNIEGVPAKILQSLRQANVAIDTFLAVTKELNVNAFSEHSMRTCISEALNQYPFRSDERELVRLAESQDFHFRGSNELMVFVLFNLLKNALWAIKSSQRGEILISISSTPRFNLLHFTDTASGIDNDDLPYIFEAFFSTKRHSGGTGVGLSFCQHVLQAFGGDIACRSEKGKYTTFVLKFPHTLPTAG